jgi:probable rRNA maturation factor
MTQPMIVISTNHAFLRFQRKDVIRSIHSVYHSEKKTLGSIAIINTHDQYIRKINKTYLRHDYVTDVIAFPLGADGDVEGEIYLNLDAARRQAREFKIPYTEECKRLLIHGVLHLLGYRDATQKQKKNMHTLEDTYLKKLKNTKTVL